MLLGLICNLFLLMRLSIRWQWISSLLVPFFTLSLLAAGIFRFSDYRGFTSYRSTQEVDSISFLDEAAS